MTPLCLRHLEAFGQALRAGRPLALTRWGDGERAILQNCEISTYNTNRHWCYRPSLGISDRGLSAELAAAFDLNDPGWSVGISCPCCNEDDHAYYKSRLGPGRPTTYANLFSNGNWKYLAARLTGWLSELDRPVVLVSNFDRDWQRARHSLPYNRVEVVPLGDASYQQPIPNPLGSGFYRGGCTHWYSQNRSEAQALFIELARKHRGAVFLVSFGPIANLAIHTMFLEQPDNLYLDMGHALDGILYGEETRPYMAGAPAALCHDMDAGWEQPSGE